MKRKVKYFVLSMALICISATTVFAGNTSIMPLTNYSVSSGSGKEIAGLKSNAKYAMAEMEIDSLTGSGENKTRFIGYLHNGTLYVSKASKVVSISAYRSQIVKIGNVGTGTWMIGNDAFSGATNYVGWSGKLGILSSTTA